MRLDANNPWHHAPSHTSLVNIGTHSLWASISGPLRTPTSPLLIFITGAGGPSASLVQLAHLLSLSVRVLLYDRAGYDRSSLPPGVTTILASDSAADLTKLLQETRLGGPYILVAHSYGGIIARTFLEAHKQDERNGVVAGMCLLDTGSEIMFDLFPRMPPLCLMAVAREVDFSALTDLKRESGMTDEQWEYAALAVSRCVHAAALEDTHGSAYALALHRQLDVQTLGGRPLTVVQCNSTADAQRLYDEGVRLGGGTEEQRRESREFIEKFGAFHGVVSRAVGGLSTEAEVLWLEEWGHDFPIRRPVVAAGIIRKLVGRVVERGGARGVNRWQTCS